MLMLGRKNGLLMLQREVKNEKQRKRNKSKRILPEILCWVKMFSSPTELRVERGMNYTTDLLIREHTANDNFDNMYYTWYDVCSKKEIPGRLKSKT